MRAELGMIAGAMVLLACPQGGAQQIWLAPNGIDSVDFSDLFSPAAPWQNAARKTMVFKLQNILSDAILRSLIGDLNRRGIALAWDLDGLTYTDTCGQGVPGFVGPANGDPAGGTLAGARYLKALGANVKYVEFDEPYLHGSLWDGKNACHWSARTVAENLVLHVRAIQSVFPDVQVGDMEPVPQLNERHGQMVALYQPWLDAWRQVSGKEFAFLQADVGWGVPGVASDLEDMRHLLAPRGIAFGVMYAGHNYFKPQTDLDWTSTAEREFTDYELEAGRPPDQGIIQSWDPLPSHALPETTPGSLTYLLTRYARERPQLTAAVLGAQVSGKLSGSGGSAIPGASVSVAAVANSGTGIIGEFTITGFVPAGTDRGTAGFRINADCNTNCNGSADLSLYRVAYTESTGYTVSLDFTNGMQGWSAWGTAWTGTAEFETGSAGRGLHVTVSPTQYFGLNSPFFRMTPGATFTVTITARVPPSASASGNYSVFLLNGNSQVMRLDHELTSGKRNLGVATTGADGAYQLGLTESFDGSVSLVATYSGSDQYWPASVGASLPTVTVTSVVNAASFKAPLARCALATVFGTNLAGANASAQLLPLPTKLGDAQVTVGGVAAPLIWVSPAQINFQVPCELPLRGTVSMSVTSGGAMSGSQPVTLAPYAPGVFTYARTSSVLDPVVVHLDNSLVTPDRPAKPGEYLVAYATGVGNLSPMPTTGAGAPALPVAASVDLPEVTVGGAAATVAFAGLTPGFVGLVQINLQLPSSLPLGSSLPLVVSFAGSASPPVNLAVQQ